MFTIYLKTWATQHPFPLKFRWYMEAQSDWICLMSTSLSGGRASTFCPFSCHLCRRSGVMYWTVNRGSGSLCRWSLQGLSSHNSIVFITSPDDWDEKVLWSQIDKNLLLQWLILVSSCRCLCSKISICVNTRAEDSNEETSERTIPRGVIVGCVIGDKYFIEACGMSLTLSLRGLLVSGSSMQVEDNVRGEDSLR